MITKLPLGFTAATATAIVAALAGTLAGSTPVLVATAVVLAGLAVACPGAVAVAAIVTAPLHLYRRDVPPEVADLVGSLNISGFRLCVLATALGLAANQLLPSVRARRIASAKAVAAVGVLFAIVAAWQVYEASRSLSPLGPTLASAHVFFLLAAYTMAAAVLLGTLTPRSALVAVVASAALPFAYAAFQVLSPGDGADKYVRPVPFAGLLDAEIGTDQTRGGGLGGNVFRPAAFFSDPNFLAIFAVGVIVSLDLLRAGIGRWSRILLAGQFAAGIVVLVTLSRSGLIALVAYGIARLVLHAAATFAPERRVRIPRSSLARISLVVGAVALGVGIWVVMSSRDLSGSTDSHLETIRQALTLWADYPVDGAGLGNFGYAYGQPFDRSSAQSFPFTILAEQGLIGTMLIGAAFVALPWWAGGGLLGLLRVPLGLVPAIGMWFYDFPLAIDVCAVWLGLAAAARWSETLRLQAAP